MLSGMAGTTPNFSEASYNRFVARVTAQRKPVRNVTGFVSILVKMVGRSTRAIRQTDPAIRANKSPDKVS
jgi:hypothetical protein